MCGRIAQTLPPAKLAEIFGIEGPVPEFEGRNELAPSETALVVRRHPETGQRHLDPLVWGLVPGWAKDAKIGAKLFNARAETAAEKPSFREAFAKRHALVPVDRFYEWQKTDQGKKPFAIAGADGKPLALAGLWEGWRAPDGSILRSFTILTCAANRAIAPIHDRMPVILAEADWAPWLAGQAVTLGPCPDEGLRIEPTHLAKRR